MTYTSLEISKILTGCNYEFEVCIATKSIVTVLRDEKDLKKIPHLKKRSAMRLDEINNC